MSPEDPQKAPEAVQKPPEALLAEFTPKTCSLCRLLSNLSAPVKDFLARLQQEDSSCTETEPWGTSQYHNQLQSAKASSGLSITIPIIRPPGWDEIDRLLQKMPLAFDERGAREAMTVRLESWGSFVDRQKSKLEGELNDAVQNELAELMGGTESRGEDVAELKAMLECMEDWKDLTRFSGKSMSMASTRRGQYMKIHVVAFAEREDKTGIDFMRLSYRKSVELCRPTRTGTHRRGTSWSRPLGGLLDTVLGHAGYYKPGERYNEGQWLELIRRPDVAKYVIALAFEKALEADGVRLEFVSPKLNAN